MVYFVKHFLLNLGVDSLEILNGNSYQNIILFRYFRVDGKANDVFVKYVRHVSRKIKFNTHTHESCQTQVQIQRISMYVPSSKILFTGMNFFI